MRTWVARQIVRSFLFLIAFATFQSHADEPAKLDKDTLVLWSFDEVAGNTVTSDMKNTTAELTGGATVVDGKFGKAISFNGIDGKLATHNSKQHRIGTSQGCTIEAWVQVHKHGQTQPIYSGPPYFELEVRGEGVVSFNFQTVDGKTNLRCTGKKNVVDGAWHHIAGVRDPKDRKVRVFVDGVLDVEVDDTTAGSELVIADNVLVGSNGSGTETFGGIIDDLRISGTVRRFSPRQSDAAASASKQEVLENDKVKIVFDVNGSALSLASLVDKKTNVEFISPKAKKENLWQASMKSSEGNVMLGESGFAPKIERQKLDRAQGISFTWKDLSIAQEKSAVDVMISVSLANDSSLADWRINLDNRSKKFGVWTAKFPRISNLAKLSNDGKDVIAIPGGNGGGAGEGQVYPDPFKTLTHPFVRTYPCYLQSMQFNTYYNDKAGLYLATHDGKMNLKGFLLQANPGENPTVIYEVHHYPANSGVAGVGLSQDYPQFIGTFNGTWYDACKIYRKWALDQVWCQAGKLDQRKDISPWIQKGAYWMVGTFEWKGEQPILREKIRRMTFEEHVKSVRQLDVEKSLAMVREAREYFGFPLLLWTNEWFDGGGDISPPRYVPQGGLDDYLRRLHKEYSDVYVSGHMQMKRYSVQLAEYNKDVEDSFEYLPNGEKAIEPLDAMDKGDQIGYPCWETPFWRNFWNNKAKEIVKVGLDGFHCDELGSATGFDYQCFNPHHGHPIGGGTMYADTRRYMINMLRESARTVRPGFAIHHEALCEIYLDRVDLAEVCTAPSNKNAPLFETVYHDYAFTMGRRIHPWMDRRTFPMGDPKYGDNDIPQFAASFAQTYIWGNQPGWTRLDIVQYSPKVAALIKRYMEVRNRNLKFLNVGEYIRPLDVKTPQEMIKTIWTTCDTPEHIQPAVLNSVWKASDGSIGIVLANTTATARKIHYGYDLSENGGKHGAWTLRRTDGSTPIEIENVKGDSIERTDEVPAYSAIVIEAVPRR
jgi:hypothetical protein